MISIQSHLHQMTKRSHSKIFLYHLKKCLTLIMPQYDQWELVFCHGAAAIIINIDERPCSPDN